MKKLCILLFLAAAFRAAPLMAQNQIGSWTFNSGMASTSNATFEVVTSVGEPIIGVMSNSQFTLKSGSRYSVGKDTVVTSIGGPDELRPDRPDKFALEQNHPNPFNPSTIIPYQVPENSSVKLEVFNPLGKRVAVLVNEQKNAGSYSTRFDASRLAGGVYLYRFSAGDFVQTKKMMLIK